MYALFASALFRLPGTSGGEGIGGSAAATARGSACDEFLGSCSVVSSCACEVSAWYLSALSWYSSSRICFWSTRISSLRTWYVARRLPPPLSLSVLAPGVLESPVAVSRSPLSESLGSAASVVAVRERLGIAICSR